MTLIRGTSLSGFTELVTELGADPVLLLRRHRLPLAAVGDYEAFVDYVGLLRVLQDAAEATRAPDFGRQLAARQGIEILGSVGAAARTAPTLTEAMSTFGRYLRAYSPAIHTLVEPARERFARFEFRILLDRLPPHSQGTELALGVALRVFRLLLGEGWSPVRVHLPHEALTARRDYVSYFGAPPTFADQFAGFTILAADLAHPVSPDQTTHAALMAYLEGVAPAGSAGVSDTVGELARRLLPTGTLDLEIVASQLALHPRTLQRRLAEEGTTFEQVVDEVRRRMTERYLQDTDMSLGHLASELGYGEQSALTRASRRWFGSSPLAYRKAMRGSMAGGVRRLDRGSGMRLVPR